MNDLTLWLIIGVVLGFLFYILIVYYLWNFVVPKIFPTSEPITILQTGALIILIGMIFNSGSAYSIATSS